jgi:AraC-like DNA-binding protein
MGVVTGTRETPLGRVEFARRPPLRALRDDVIHLTGFAEDYRAPVRRLEVPFGGVPLIVSLGPRHRMLDPERPGAAPSTRTSFVAGLHDRATLVEHDGASCGVEVYFTPLGARRFLGLPGAELTNQVVELEDVLGPEAGRLADRVAEAPTWAARFDTLEAAILARARAAPQLPPAVEWAWRRLRDSEGGAGIDALAAEAGYSRRHLTGRFHAELGLPPKTFARVLRFDRAVELLRSGAGLADVAYSCGYADQPHFNRDFRALASTTPTDFVARVRPDGAGVNG